MAEVNIANTEEGRVYLLAGGGKIYTDLAAKFVRTEKPVAELIQEAYNPAIVRNILESHHYSALEFDMLIFGVEGYSRVTEAQLIRKRIASYLIKSGRAELNGKRAHSYVIPENVRNFSCDFNLYSKDLCDHTTVEMCGDDIADICSHFYDCGLEAGLPEEDLRYIKPQGTEFKAIVALNAHAIRDWFKIRCCENAQHEIRDMAFKMLRLSKEALPDLFVGAGANCVELGYCPEGKRQCAKFKGKIPTKEQILEVWRKHKDDVDIEDDLK